MSRAAAIDCGLELRFKPPSSATAALTSFSQASKSSGLFAYEGVSVKSDVVQWSTYDVCVELLDLDEVVLVVSVIGHLCAVL